MSNTPANNKGAQPAPKPEDTTTQTFAPTGSAQPNTTPTGSAPANANPAASMAPAAAKPENTPEAGPEAGKSEGAAQTTNSPLLPASANPTPVEGAATPSASQTEGSGIQQGTPTSTTPNMASTPSSSMSAPATSGTAPKIAPAGAREDGHGEGGVVLVNPDAAPDNAPSDTPGAKVAALFRQQIDILTMRIFYEAQELMRVGALAPDPVMLRTIVLSLTNDLEKNDRAGFYYTFTRVNLTISPQINDQVIPLHSGLLLSSLIDGVLRDTINQGFKDDLTTRDQAITLLDQMTDAAYQQLMRQPSYLEKPLAPRI